MKLLIGFIKLCIWSALAIIFYILEWALWPVMWAWRLMMSCRKFFEEGCDMWRDPSTVEMGWSSPNIWDEWKYLFSGQLFRDLKNGTWDKEEDL